MGAKLINPKKKNTDNAFLNLVNLVHKIIEEEEISIPQPHLMPELVRLPSTNPNEERYKQPGDIDTERYIIISSSEDGKYKIVQVLDCAKRLLTKVTYIDDEIISITNRIYSENRCVIDRAYHIVFSNGRICIWSARIDKEHTANVIEQTAGPFAEGEEIHVETKYYEKHGIDNEGKIHKRVNYEYV